MKNDHDSNEFQPRDLSLLIFVVIAVLIFVFGSDGNISDFLTQNLTK